MFSISKPTEISTSTIYLVVFLLLFVNNNPPENKMVTP